MACPREMQTKAAADVATGMPRTAHIVPWACEDGRNQAVTQPPRWDTGARKKEANKTMQQSKGVGFRDRWLELSQDKGEEFARRCLKVEPLLDNARGYLRPPLEPWERLIPDSAYRTWAEGGCRDDLLLWRHVFDPAVDVLRDLVDDKAEEITYWAGDPDWCAENAERWREEIAAAAAWKSLRRWQRDEIIHYVADEWIVEQARAMKEVEESRVSRPPQEHERVTKRPDASGQP